MAQKAVKNMVPTHKTFEIPTDGTVRVVELVKVKP
jgi:monomeric isocitrate dehydrogenase